MPSNKEGYMKLYYQKNREKMLNNMLEELKCQKYKKSNYRKL